MEPLPFIQSPFTHSPYKKVAEINMIYKINRGSLNKITPFSYFQIAYSIILIYNSHKKNINKEVS